MVDESGKKPLWFKLIIALIVIIVIVGGIAFSIITTIKPMKETLQKFASISEIFERPVVVNSLCYNTTSITSLNSLKESLIEVDRDIITNNSITYTALLANKNKEKENLILSESEFASLINLTKNCGQFVAESKIKKDVTYFDVFGYEQYEFRDKILVKFDIKYLLKSVDLSALFDNNLFLTISKNLTTNSIYYQINQFNGEEQAEFEEVMNELMKSDGNYASIQELTEIIYDLCFSCIDSLKTFINIDINFE